MQIGVVYPQTELRGDPAAVRQIGKATEDLGFQHLVAYDHVLGAVHADRARPLTGPYTEHDPFHDPLVMFAYLAGITGGIQFASGVLVLPQRPAALVARQAADVDLLSGGLRLGVGVGWNHVEYEALGQDFSTRGARQEEQIEVLRRLFTSRRGLRRAASTASTESHSCRSPARPIPIGSVDLPKWRRPCGASRGRLHVLRWERRRDRRRLDGSLRDRVRDPADRSTTSVRNWLVLPRNGGSDVRADVDAWREAGGTHISLITMGLGLDSAEAHVDYLAAVAATLALS